MGTGGSGYSFTLWGQELAYGCLSGLWSALNVSQHHQLVIFTTSGIKHAVITPLQPVRQWAMKDCTPDSVMSWFLCLPWMAFLCKLFCFLPPPHPFYHELHGHVNCKQKVTGNVEVLTCFSQRNKVSRRKEMLKYNMKSFSTFPLLFVYAKLWEVWIRWQGMFFSFTDPGHEVWCLILLKGDTGPKWRSMTLFLPGLISQHHSQPR